jgi:hypothetical protein
MGPDEGRRGARLGQTGCSRQAPHLAYLAPRLASSHYKTIAKPLQNRCKIVAKPAGGRRGARRGQTGYLTGQTEGLFTFKRKNDMFCIRVI